MIATFETILLWEVNIFGVVLAAIAFSLTVVLMTFLVLGIWKSVEQSYQHKKSLDKESEGN